MFFPSDYYGFSDRWVLPENRLNLPKLNSETPYFDLEVSSSKERDATIGE